MKAQELIDILKEHPGSEVTVHGIMFYDYGYEDSDLDDVDIKYYHEAGFIIRGYEHV